MKQIYIKTDMTEMPKFCHECDYVKITLGEFWCKKTTVKVLLNEYNKPLRPKWCPLVEIKEADK